MDLSSKPAGGLLKALGSLLLTSFREWVSDRCGGFAAAMAFKAVLMLSSFFLAVLVVSARVFGENWVLRSVLPAMRAWKGPGGQAAIEAMLQSEGFDVYAATTITLIGMIALVYGASGLFLQIQDALQTIWNVRREVPIIARQLMRRALGLCLAAASILIAMAGFAAAGSLAPFDLDPASPPTHTYLRLLGQSLIAFATFWALVTLHLKVLLPVRLTLRQIVPWSAGIAALHLLGRLAFVFLANLPGVPPAIDVAEAITLALMWSYFASNVFLYGAQVMRVYLLRYGGVSQPQGRG